MEKREKREKMEVSTGMKICRVISIIMLIAAIVYVSWRGDFDSRGLTGYVDDFFVFMTAYMFTRGSFLKPEHRYIRRQFYMLSSLFALLSLCWIFLLAFMK